MTVKRMDNVCIVVEDIDAAVGFFTELGLTLEDRMPIEGEWAGRRHLPALLHPGSRRNSHRARPTARAADFPGEPHGT